MQSSDIITSRGNAHIKLALSVRKSARSRRENGLFFLEGARLCADAVSSGTAVLLCLYTEKAAEKYASLLLPLTEHAATCLCIDESLSGYLAETEHPQGVFCLCQARSTEVQFRADGRYIALSFVQNPDNLGAIARSAEAFGLDALILEGGCDPYNPKAQRAAMGSLLRLPILETEDLPALLARCRESGMQVWASTPQADALPVTQADRSGGIVCVVGNEGAGLRDAILQSCTRVTIPMRGRAESLNAAQASSVLMWEMVREVRA